MKMAVNNPNLGECQGHRAGKPGVGTAPGTDDAQAPNPEGVAESRLPRFSPPAKPFQGWQSIAFGFLGLFQPQAFIQKRRWRLPRRRATRSLGDDGNALRRVGVCRGEGQPKGVEPQAFIQKRRWRLPIQPTICTPTVESFKMTAPFIHTSAAFERAAAQKKGAPSFEAPFFRELESPACAVTGVEAHVPVSQQGGSRRGGLCLPVKA